MHVLILCSAKQEISLIMCIFLYLTSGAVGTSEGQSSEREKIEEKNHCVIRGKGREEVDRVQKFT